MKAFIQNQKTFVEINLYNKKINVFNVMKNVNNIQIKKSFWIDKTKIFHVAYSKSKSSHGPIQVWVPKLVSVL